MLLNAFKVPEIWLRWHDDFFKYGLCIPALGGDCKIFTSLYHFKYDRAIIKNKFVRISRMNLCWYAAVSPQTRSVHIVRKGDISSFINESKNGLFFPVFRNREIEDCLKDDQ